MPSPLDQHPIVVCDFHQLAQRTGFEAEAGADPNLRFQPNLGLTAAGAHMHRLARVALVRVDDSNGPKTLLDHRSWLAGKLPPAACLVATFSCRAGLDRWCDGAGYLSYLSPQIDGFLSISGYRNLVGTTTVSSVLEPGSLGLYAAGLAFVGLCARRRPRAAQHPSAA
jgi:hypothetical protein